MLLICGKHIIFAFVVWPCFDLLDIPQSAIYGAVWFMSEIQFSTVPDVLANSHGSNDLLYRLFSLLFLLIVQLCLQFKDLPCKRNQNECWQQQSLNILSDIFISLKLLEVEIKGKLMLKG